jgi:predicted lipid-binding transport protein (Tim44 family)
VTQLPLDEAFDPSVLIFAALAVFVLWKLRSVLGERNDREGPTLGRFQPTGAPLGGAPLPGAAPISSAAKPLPADRWNGVAETGSKAWAGLDGIAATDAAFSGPAFIEGARKAYEIIVAAFAKGDRDTLRRLLSADVFDGFAAEISSREARGESVESALVSIDSAVVDDARALPQSNSVTVRFTSKLITARRNRQGEVIEGDPSQAAKIVDLWTFARNPRARDPNWKLVATETVH